MIGPAMVRRQPALSQDITDRYRRRGAALVSRRGACETVIGQRDVLTPEVRFSRWRGESAISLRALDFAPTDVTTDRNVIRWRAHDREVWAYDLGFEESGGFEIEVHLLTKPASNLVRFAVTRDNVVIWPQPADRRRAGHVVGSLAVYHPTAMGDYRPMGGPNYRSGKVGHIWRPWAEDSGGRRVWGDFVLDREQLAIRLPQDFLDSAIYPVLVDPTFGYTTAGATDDNGSTNWLLWKAQSTPAAGSLTSITVRGRIKSGPAPNQNPAIYSDSAGAPNARLAFSNTGGTGYGAADGDVLSNLAYGSLTATQYWIGSFNENSGSSDFWFKFDTNGGATELYLATETVGWPASASGAGNAPNSRATVYGTYTASGGGGGTVKNGSSRMFFGLGT